MGLLSVADAAQILAPGGLLGVADQVGAGDVVVVAKFGTTQAGEVGLRAVGAGAVDAVAVLVVDPPHGEPGLQRVPGRALIGMNHRCRSDPLADAGNSGVLGGEDLRQGAATALAHDLKARGLVVAPELATGDGALGFWKALDEMSPTTRHQRCTVHKTVNVMDKLPKSVQPVAKADLREV